MRQIQTPITCGDLFFFSLCCLMHLKAKLSIFYTIFIKKNLTRNFTRKSLNFQRPQSQKSKF